MHREDNGRDRLDLGPSRCRRRQTVHCTLNIVALFPLFHCGPTWSRRLGCPVLTGVRATKERVERPPSRVRAQRLGRRHPKPPVVGLGLGLAVIAWRYLCSGCCLLCRLPDPVSVPADKMSPCLCCEDDTRHIIAPVSPPLSSSDAARLLTPRPVNSALLCRRGGSTGSYL